MTGVAIAVLSAWNHHLLKEFFVKTMFLALGVAAILSGTFTASNAAAATKSSAAAQQAPKIELYECGLQVGKSIGALVGANAKENVVNSVKYLSEDITNYIAQVKLAATLSDGRNKSQVLQAATNSFRSIEFSMEQIKEANPGIAAAIQQACDL